MVYLGLIEPGGSDIKVFLHLAPVPSPITTSEAHSNTMDGGVVVCLFLSISEKKKRTEKAS